MLLCVLLRFYYNASAQAYHQFLNLLGTAVSRGKFVGLVPTPNVDVGIPTAEKVISVIGAWLTPCGVMVILNILQLVRLVPLANVNIDIPSY